MRFQALLILALMTNATLAQTAPRATPPGQDFLKALSFAQHFAKPEALTPENDRRLKSTLLKAMQEKPPVLSFDEVKDIFPEKEFAVWANKDQLSMALIDVILREATPEIRRNIARDVVAHIDLLSTQFDMIDQPHQQAANELADWIAKNFVRDQELGVKVICTGNSRRSMLGAVMGNIAADYWGMPHVNFYSGGTAPSAFNARTIEALKKIGIKVDNTGREAMGGQSNWTYEVRWAGWLGAEEYSKHYTDARLPQKDFAAILVCDEADEACPIVEGASIRISAPFFDPKAYDNTALEAAKYAERRDDIGRMMLSALMQARRQLQK